MLHVQVKKQVTYKCFLYLKILIFLFKKSREFLLSFSEQKWPTEEKHINGFCTAGKVTICHKVWVFMAYKMQSECLETKKK